MQPPPDGGWRRDQGELPRSGDEPFTLLVLDLDAQDATDAPKNETEVVHIELGEATSETLRALDSAQEVGLQGAKHYLERQGDSAITILDGGGWGGAPPDLLSLTADGKLRVTEAKGTNCGTPLAKAGLDRWNPVTGDTLFENSPEWLAKSVDKVVARLEGAIDAAEGPAKRAELCALLDAYLEQAETGFQEKDEYVRTVVQTGENLSVLNADDLPALIRDYIADVEPDAIVQQSLRDQ